MKKLFLLTTLLFSIILSSTYSQKGATAPSKSKIPTSSAAGCPLVVSIQDNNPTAVCSELLKTLVAITSPCTDTTAVGYKWSSSVGGVFSTSRTTTFNLPDFLVATPVTFTVWVIEGSDSLSANYSVTVKPRPSRPSLSPFGTILLCDNNVITLSSSACTGGSTTIWSNGTTGVNTISVPATGGTYFKVACEKNGCVSDSTAAAALTTGTITTSPTVTNRIICEGAVITAGNGLQAQLVNCNASASGTYTYTGGTVGYDRGYRSSGSIDPKVTVPSVAGNISNIRVSITWRKQKGGYENSCGAGDTESWPYHNETQFRIQSPSGKIITLVNTYTYGGADNPTVTTVFEDGASPVNFYSPPVSGTFAPAQPLSGFIGENPTGVWTLLPYDAVGKDPLCVSGFAVTFTADTQVGNLTWWDAPTGGNQVGTGSEFIPTNTTAGTYTYYAQGQCVRKCPSVRTPTTLTINPTPPAPVISVNVPEVSGVRNICGGESVTLTATGCNNGGTVKWNSSYNGTNFATGSPYTFVPSFSNSSSLSQTFTAACEGTNICRSVVSNSLTINVKQKPAQPTILGPGNNVCVNSNVTLTASACSGGTLGWTGNRSGGSINFVLTSAVNIKVACTVNGCTSDSSNVYSITPLARPNAVTVNASQVQALCYGSSVNLSASTCAGTIKWTGNLSGSPVTVTPLASRSYKASCLGTNGCPSDSSAALNIIVLPKTKPTITGSTFICGTGAGIPVTLTATGCSGVNETVMWRSEDTGLTYTETISQTKTFRAICIRNGYCVSDSSDIFTVQYRNKPSQPTITPPQNTTICQGTIVSLTTTACTGGTLGWTGGLSGTSISISAVGTKSYKVACTINGCTSDSSSAVTITVNPKPTQPTITSSGNTVCQGTNVTLTSSACVNGTYGWTGGLTTSSITISSVGARNYKVACTINGCTSDSSAVTTVQIKVKPSQPTITPPQNTTICQGTSVSLTTSACTGGTLGWTGGLSGQTVSVSPNITKSYKVACTVNGCVSDSSAVLMITVNPTPVISVNANKTSICSGDSAILTVSGCTGTLSWSNGATAAVIKVFPAVNTTYTATCTLGSCSANQSVSITALSTPNVTASGILQCGQSVTLTANNVPSGSSIQWRKDGVDIAGATNSTLVINSAGSYDFRVGLSISTVFDNASNNSSVSIFDVKFFNENIGYYAVNDVIRKTTNGGNTWVDIYTLADMKSVFFVDSNNLWAISSNTIAKSINGGLTWTTINNSSYPFSGTSLSSIYFKNINEGLILAFDKVIYTTNGGGTWTFGSNFPGTPNKFVYVPNSTNIFATAGVVGGSTIQKSTNNGVTWNIVLSAPSRFDDIQFINQSIGWAVRGGSIYKTTDGGNNWNFVSVPINSPSSAYPVSFNFISEQVGYFYSDGKLLKTINGGNTWTIIDNVYTYSISPIGGISTSFIAEDKGWYSYQRVGNFFEPVGKIVLKKISTPQCSTTPLLVAPPQRPNAPSITQPSNSTICQGSSVTLSAIGCTGGTYAWTGGLSGTSISVSPSVTRAYKVACTLNTCTSDSSSVVTINVTPAPVFSLNSNKTSICSGDTATLTVSGCTGTLSWSNGATTAIIKVSPVVNTTYTATCTLGTCSANQSVSITALSTPNVTASGILQCGQSVTLTANNVPSGSSIQWRKDGVDIANATNSTLVINSAGSYDFVVGALISTVTTITVPTPNGYPDGLDSRNMRFLDSNNGYTFNQNKLWKTADGGINWVNTYTHTTNIRSIHFVDNNLGWAIADSRKILKTTNGGINWTIYNDNGFASNLLGILFKNSNVGIIYCENGQTVSTSDGGVTWNINSSSFSSTSGLYYNSKLVYVPNSNKLIIGYGFGGDWYLKKSLDNGISWNTINTPSIRLTGVNDIHFSTSNDGWLSGYEYDKLLLKTTDGGDTWVRQNTNIIQSIYNKIYFVNPQLGYLQTQQGGDIYKTKNGGTTWSLFTSTTGDFNFNMGFFSEDNGWLSYHFDSAPSSYKLDIKKISTPQCPTTPKVMTNICCSTFETIKSGSWTDPTVWSCNRVPVATDDVIINIGHTITDNGNTIHAKTLNYRGGLLKLSTTTNFILR